MTKYISIIIILVFVLFGCGKNDEYHHVKNIKYSEPPIDLQGVDVKYARNIPYDTKESTRFDIFIPNSKKPTPLVIYVHGGGFVGGNKGGVYSAENGFLKGIRTLLRENIAFATIEYSLLDIKNETEGIKKSMNDVKRALQFIRHKSEILNIDKNKIVLVGSSAGAGTSLFIAFSDDMKDIANDDEVLRESTRVVGVAVMETQCTYDIQKWEDDILIDFGFKISYYDPKYINRIYSLSSFEEFYSPRTVAYRKDVDMLNLLSSDDPEFFASNKRIGILQSSKISINAAEHHPYHVKALKQRADSVGVKNVCYYGNGPNAYKDLSNESLIGFVLRKLK